MKRDPEKQRCHPLKGWVKATPPSQKKLFCLTRNVISGLTVLLSLSASAISFQLVSGHQFATDPHQSPIWIKVLSHLNICAVNSPLALSGPRKPSVSCRVQVEFFTNLWFLTNPVWAHDIGKSDNKSWRRN